MKAIRCRDYGPPESMTLEDVAPLPLGPADLRIRVRAAGVNLPDALFIEGKYQERATPPFTPGFEVAGEVVELGPQAQGRGFAVGDRVAALMFGGAFAEEAVVPWTNAVRLPAHVDDATAAAMYVAYGTAMNALDHRGRLAAGETLLVTGASGGVGTAAVQLGRAMGATVIGAGGDDAKLAAVAADGCAHVVNYRNEDLRRRVLDLTGEAGADAIVETVGGEVFNQCLRCVAWEGRLLVVGFASGVIPQAPVNRTILRSCALVGVSWGRFAMRNPQANAESFRRMFAWCAEGKLRPRIAATLPLAEAGRAIRTLLNREIAGKIVLSVG
jgi:NADPH2:quinone reductase